jgi:hypothetical protein
MSPKDTCRDPGYQLALLLAEIASLKDAAQSRPVHPLAPYTHRLSCITIHELPPHPSHIDHPFQCECHNRRRFTHHCVRVWIRHPSNAPSSLSLDTLVVSTLQDTLLTVSQIIQHAHVFYTKSSFFIIHPQPPPPKKAIIAIGHSCNGVYEVSTSPPSGTANAMRLVPHLMHPLHTIFDHAGELALNSIRKTYGTTATTLSKVISPILPVSSTPDRAPCHAGRQTRAPYPLSDATPQPHSPLSQPTQPGPSQNNLTPQPSTSK